MNKKSEKRELCSQCGKRGAICTIGSEPVCIQCEHVFQQSRYMQFAQNAAMMNLASQELDAVVGIGPPSPRIAIPPAPVPPIYFNSQSVNVSGSTVGNINLGVARDIQSHLQVLTESGNVALSETLAELTNAILNAEDVDENSKNELVEQIALVTEQAAAKPDDRKPGQVKAIVGAIKEGADAISSVSGAWSAAEPMIRTFFGI
ncbi:hypothetical protein GRI34_04000 [Erythrobacter aquimaris]|uniref:Uncharacterized protein n=1 Tax=Qipengyuania aquimaris TaxID=255984 RepID=A0A6I4TKN6_9SPHN|nr:hypothetical protein [Qipengyuania aquimaris]MXO95581.1 hypothetical protein [Qipengyuania aquimaris]